MSRHACGMCRDRSWPALGFFRKSPRFGQETHRASIVYTDPVRFATFRWHAYGEGGTTDPRDVSLLRVTRAASRSAREPGGQAIEGWVTRPTSVSRWPGEGSDALL